MDITALYNDWVLRSESSPRLDLSVFLSAGAVDVHLEALPQLVVEVSHATVRVHVATVVQSDVVSRAIPHQTLSSPDTITFNHLNWNEEVVVVLAAVDDLVEEGPNTLEAAHPATVSFLFESEDASYATAATDVFTFEVAIVDDDDAGIEMVFFT